ncbi:MAG: RdgB/HAM1 family non-canonical purine NTP pyrophosphatase [Candidatus Cloacimonetes bacterium]|nr:RdgB/HAM1 family non-canonical purine NTP pyrophosphatase [Candidatus Cloacimonadota bacterium]MBL7086378.1 RdgB/HAM1 family non-canonical purine NTP pyrophosphatase [Candidatus Cloacimonadota bacterium]
MKLVLATQNKDKIKEITLLLHDLPIEILTYKDFDFFPNIIEDKNSLKGNAEKKARKIWEEFKESRVSVLADDTGLFVDALNGKPGVYSSRFAGENVSYKHNRQKLLNMLKNVPKGKRTATFRTVIVLIMKNGNKIVAQGQCKGYIGFEEKGDKGFGYDSIFYLNGYNKSFAQLTRKEKNKISHRGIALRKIRAVLKEISNNNNNNIN